MAHTHTPNLNLYKPSTGDAAASWTAGLNANSDTIDALRIDQLQAGTDITAGNASTTAHGLLPKLPNDSTLFLAGDGTWITAGGSGTTDHAALSNLDYASAGHTGFASTARATTGADGLLPQLSGNAVEFLNGNGQWVTAGTGTVTSTGDTPSGNVPVWVGTNTGVLGYGYGVCSSVPLTGADGNSLPTDYAVRNAIDDAIAGYTQTTRTGTEPVEAIDDDITLTVDDLNKCYTIEATTDPVTVTLPAASTGRYGQWLSFTLINGTGGLTIQGPTGVVVGDFNLGDANKRVSSGWTPMQSVTIRVVQTDISPGAKWAIISGTGTWTAEEAS